MELNGKGIKEKTVQIRIYKSDWKKILKKSRVMDTTIARIIHEIVMPL